MPAPGDPPDSPVPAPPATAIRTSIDRLEAFRGADLHDLCDAADLAIRGGGGFGWVEPPPREVMERYWRGVLAVPGRSLFVGRLDGVVAGSAQLVRPPPNNEAQAFSATLTTFFVAPWARGHGLARALVEAVEAEARDSAYEVLHLDVRETQGAAIRLYQAMGWVLWGTNPLYARVNGRTIAGYYFYKLLRDRDAEGAAGASPTSGVPDPV
jgi:ribosomal protein S18 acetylase RimI-like enzyme